MNELILKGGNHLATEHDSIIWGRERNKEESAERFLLDERTGLAVGRVQVFLSHCCRLHPRRLTGCCC